MTAAARKKTYAVNMAMPNFLSSRHLLKYNINNVTATVPNKVIDTYTMFPPGSTLENSYGQWLLKATMEC